VVVLGKYSYIVNYTGKTAQVLLFSPEFEALKVPIVDAGIQYDDPYSGESYLLVCKEALFVAAMTHNLIPTFLMREAGLVVDDVPKVQSTNLTMQHHSTYFPEENLRIPLGLHGIFSYFPSSQPSLDVLNDNNFKVLFLTIGQIDPHNKIYEENERAMLDHEGNMIEKEHRKSYVVDSTSVPEKMECAAFVGEVENRAINDNIKYLFFHNSDFLINEDKECESEIEANEKANIIGNLAERLALDGKLSQLKMSIGSCNMYCSQCLEDASMYAVATEDSTRASDYDNTESEKSVDF